MYNSELVVIKNVSFVKQDERAEHGEWPHSVLLPSTGVLTTDTTSL